MEYADEVLDFLKKYHSKDDTSDNLGVISKKEFYSKYLQKGDHIGRFLATISKLDIPKKELIEFILSSGTLPHSWKTFIDGIKLNDKYRQNWFNIREVLIDHGIGTG